jgi:hypothetical protein
MEFYKANFLNTTTMLTMTNNTAVASNLFNRDPYYQFYTSGLNSDLSSGTITITFDAATYISRIALMDINLKDYRIYYNGVTASTLTLVNQHTTASNFSENTDANVVLKFATISVNSISLQMNKTQVANQEKIVGLFYVGDMYYSMNVIPNAGAFKPNLFSKEVVHNLSDGGVRVHRVRKKFQINMDLDYLQSSDVSSLRTIYNLNDPFQFAAFPTSTGWTNPVFFESVWTGDWRFYEYSDNAAASGFSGKVQLRETPA